MSAGNSVRAKISVVETAITNAGPENVTHAIVDVLKEIAKTLDTLDCERMAPAITVNGR
jgi:hypothetical protein